MKIINRLLDSTLFQIIVTLVVYTLYAVVMGIALAPSIVLVIYLFKATVLPSLLLLSQPALIDLIILSLGLGVAIFIYFIWGSIFKAFMIRILSIGIKPGKYPPHSVTMIRWLIYNGIYTLALKFILPAIPMSFILNLFFKIIGCKIGKNVHLNTCQLNDPFLLTIGDNVVIGGQTDISCHTFKGGHLILSPIEIGDNTLIGAHCYISPGVKIGKKCVIGLKTHVRDNRVIPDNTKWTNISMLNYRDARKYESVI